MKIEVGKKYLTRDSRKVTILATDVNHKLYPVVGIVHNDKVESCDKVVTYTKDGMLYFDSELNDCDIDLVAEYSEWNDVAVDTPVYVRADENSKWKKRHFAKYNDGRVYTFSGCRTSFTSKENYLNISWKYAKLTTKEIE